MIHKVVEGWTVAGGLFVNHISHAHHKPVCIWCTRGCLPRRRRIQYANRIQNFFEQCQSIFEVLRKRRDTMSVICGPWFILCCAYGLHGTQ